jgi:hypothetical protein
MKSEFSKKILRLFFTGGEDVTIGRMLIAGAVVWATYSVVALLATGVILDEALMPVQIITGAVQYPSGHPHQTYYLHAYNLFYYLAAAFWSIKADPMFISAIRNVSFLFLSTFVPFAFTVLLTRQPLWGHVAATLTTTETILLFKGVYPLWVFPTGYSSGHLGMHLALLIVVLLVARSWKLGGVLLGLLPALHPIMPIVVWPWSGIYFLREKLWKRGANRVWPVAATVVGLVISVALGILLFSHSTNAGAEASPYDQNQANGEFIHRQFTVTTDVHRQLPALKSLGYLLGPVAFFAIGSLLWRNTNEPSKASSNQQGQTTYWILVLGGVVGIYVYGSWLLQFFRGSLPGPIEGSMPFRFSNIYAVLLIPVTVAAIARAHQAMTESLRPLATTLLIGLVLATGSDIILNRWGRGADYPIFVAWGFLFAMQIWTYRQDRKRLIQILIAVTVVIGTVDLLFRRSRLEIIFLVSFVVVLGLFAAAATLIHRMDLSWQRLNSKLLVILICVCVATSAAAIPGRKNDRRGWRWDRADMMSPFDYDLNRWLAANTQPNEMILASVFPRSNLQSKTGHPVLMELETLWLMTYMPSLSSKIGVMSRDLYGIDYTDREKLSRVMTDGRVNLNSDLVMEAWEKRSRNEWQMLGKKYGFRLVYSETKRTLDLPVGLRGPKWTLWIIPG